MIKAKSLQKIAFLLVKKFSFSLQDLFFPPFGSSVLFLELIIIEHRKPPLEYECVYLFILPVGCHPCVSFSFYCSFCANWKLYCFNTISNNFGPSNSNLSIIYQCFNAHKKRHRMFRNEISMHCYEYTKKQFATPLKRSVSA